MSGAQFVDGVGGTNLNAANLNALAPAQSYLISGTVPSTSASLVLTVPAQVVVVNPSNAPAVAVSPASTTLTVAASSDTYIDLSAAGTYTQVAVANGAAPPAVTANTLRLWKVVSSGTAITAVVDLANRSPYGGHAAEQTTYLAAHGVALGAVGVFTTVSGESYSYITLQPSSRVQVSVSIPVNMNTLAGDLKFVLTMTAVPAGSAVPLAVLDPQWGTIKYGVTHGMAQVTTIFNADKAGTYTLTIQYVTTVGVSGSATYNESCNFGGTTTYQGAIQFVELGG